jgi:hypothetical protein
MKPDTNSSVAFPPAGSAKSYPGGLLKILAGFQLLVALGSYLASGETWPAASAIIALALAMIFFSREQIHDERVEHLKLKAITGGVVLSLLITAGVNFWEKMLKDSGIKLPLFLSAFDALILVLLVALFLFHYWRWQDGRTGRLG